MAKAGLMGTCIFLLVLILCHEAVDVEGRHLKSGSCEKCSSRHGENTVRAAKGGASSGLQQERTSKVEVDGFRPTTPGHSPGAGHSLHN
ncbi:hypothetical protein L1049_024930 [Liquidambar formosana]|uniref:Uncharacterized protein n=1 Tax=Liquidambar formosana TaxID=63359 RepID=A0AAP0X1L8_LIQFO